MTSPELCRTIDAIETAAQLRAALSENGCHADRVRRLKDGNFEVSLQFFYRHGNSSESWAAEVAQALPQGFIVTGGREDFRQWPKDSFFVAFVQVSEDPLGDFHGRNE